LFLVFAPFGQFSIYLFTLNKNMSKEDKIVIEGVVKESLSNTLFKVVLNNGREVIAHLCGKMRLGNIRVFVGDTVTLEMSPYDLTKARITYRQK
jgi:translation initiation factor IF-1